VTLCKNNLIGLHAQVAAAEEREKLKNMTEDERREWERANPKVCLFC